MNVALRKAMTLPQFLAREDRQELRYEFDGFQPVAMTGGTDAHEAIGGTLRSLLQAHLRRKFCRVRGPTMKIEVMDRIRYPDAFIYCTPVPLTETVIKNPVVVFKILGPGTPALIGSRSCANTRRPSRPSATSSWNRTASPQRADWIVHALIAEDILRMPEIEVEVPRTDIYADVQLASQSDDGAASGPPGSL